MSIQSLRTRVRVRRGRPCRLKAPQDLGTPETRRRVPSQFRAKGLRTLWEKGFIPYDLYESGRRYVFLRARCLHILKAPKIASYALGNPESLVFKNTAHAFCMPQTPDEHETLLLWQGVEKHLKSWERERITLLIQTHEGGKAVPLEVLSDVGRCLYPLLEDLTHFFQNIPPSKDRPSFRL
jgi:hypothetical protein